MLQCVIKANVTFLIFCRNNLSIDVSKVLKSPTIILLLSISSFMSVSIRFMYLGALKMGAYLFISIISYHWIDPFITGEENGNPLQYSCLENFMNRGAWQAAVHGVTKSQTRLSDFHLYLSIDLMLLSLCNILLCLLLQSLYQSLFYLK